ncbi:hypothetical protein PIB30_026571 [Stylosanthes scabra]|uniref:Uncharacterized protein n=1 Tax=Stylosanthes scabra TaxID=79078 RepID=A0ABU6TB72_9FABA|nr:hypothetical protein [Stylosanthes scabra]
MAAFQERSCSCVLMVILMPLLLVEALACPTNTFSSIFSFGDSITDTGNLYFSHQTTDQQCLSPPYGKTYFHHPSARCSDGRLIIDFIAEYLGIQPMKPYIWIKNGKLGDWSVGEGANFAVIGATALDSTFFQDRGVQTGATNYTLSVQLDWFKQFLSSHCNSSTSCEQILRDSLVIVGEIGGNDFNFPFFVKRSIAEVKSYIPHILHAISSPITELIDLGARTVMVPGVWPIGCSAMYLTIYETQDESQYDSIGCLKWVNEFTQYFNHKLQAEIQRLSGLYPHVNIFYADYYNAAWPLFSDPTKFGFKKTLKICCGNGGPYNYNASATCGKPGVVACDDPSQYIVWDGIHLTEATHKLIAEAIVKGPYSALTGLTTLCSINGNFVYHHNLSIS